MTKFVIYHNPRCSKSRQALKIIQDNNWKYEIRLYLEEKLTPLELADILNKLEMVPRDLLRKSEDDYKINNLKCLSHSDQDIINIMIKFPKLIERPIIITKNKAIIGRPPENIYHLL